MAVEAAAAMAEAAEMEEVAAKAVVTVGVRAEFAVASAASLDGRMANETIPWKGATAAVVAESGTGTMAAAASARVTSEVDLAEGLMVAATVAGSQVEEREEAMVAVRARCSSWRTSRVSPWQP